MPAVTTHTLPSQTHAAARRLSASVTMAAVYPTCCGAMGWMTVGMALMRYLATVSRLLHPSLTPSPLPHPCLTPASPQPSASSLPPASPLPHPSFTLASCLTPASLLPSPLVFSLSLYPILTPAEHLSPGTLRTGENSVLGLSGPAEGHWPDGTGGPCSRDCLWCG